jgi:hypothetical protein
MNVGETEIGRISSPARHGDGDGDADLERAGPDAAGLFPVFTPDCADPRHWNGRKGMAGILPTSRRGASSAPPDRYGTDAGAGSLERLERLLKSPAFRGFSIRRMEQGGEQALTLLRADGVTSVAFASIHLEQSTGRFFNLYHTGWSDGARTEHRHYFGSAQDAAGFLEFIVRRTQRLAVQ